MLTWNLLALACPKVDMIFQPIGVFNFEIINKVVSVVLFLFAGFLADLYFGRYKVMKVSIRVMWLGSVGGTLLLMIHLFSPHDVLKYISVVVVYVCVTIGSTELIVNAVPFNGTDQLLGASSEEISAFVHWACWALHRSS